jgi:hypothetical protein
MHEMEKAGGLDRRVNVRCVDVWLKKRSQFGTYTEKIKLNWVPVAHYIQNSNEQGAFEDTCRNAMGGNSLSLR